MKREWEAVKAEYRNHPGYREVGKMMYDICRRFHSDLPLELCCSMSLPDFTHYVHSLGYRADDSIDIDLEILSRPAAMSHPMDCKKSCIMLGCWAENMGYPYHFVAVAEADQNGDGVIDDADVHHVIILINVDGELTMIDPTRNLDTVTPKYSEVL